MAVPADTNYQLQMLWEKNQDSMKHIHKNLMDQKCNWPNLDSMTRKRPLGEEETFEIDSWYTEAQNRLASRNKTMLSLQSKLYKENCAADEMINCRKHFSFMAVLVRRKKRVA